MYFTIYNELIFIIIAANFVLDCNEYNYDNINQVFVTTDVQK